MRQVHRSLIGALLVLAVAALLVTQVLKSRQRRYMQQQADEKAARPLVLDADTLDALTLRQGESVITLQREGESWWLTSPVRDQTDEFALGRVLQAVSALRAERHFAPGEEPEPSQVGLQPPAIELEVVAGTQHARIEIGRVNSFDRQVYVRVGANEEPARMFMTAAAVRADLSQDVLALRDKRVARCAPGAVRRLEVTPAASLGAPAYALVLDSAEHWVLENKSGFQVDQDIAVELCEELCAARYVQVVEEEATNLDRYQLAPPLAEIVVGDGDGQRRLRLGGPVPDVTDKRYALRGGEDAVVVVASSLLARMTPTLAELRDRRILPIDPAHVQRIKFPLDDGRLVVVERQHADSGVEGWMMLAPRTGRAATGRIPAFLSMLTRVDASSEEPARGAEGPGEEQLKQHGLDSPVHTISLFDVEDRELATLLVGPQGQGQRWVWRRGTQALQAIDSRALDDWPRLIEDLLDSAEDAGPPPPGP